MKQRIKRNDEKKKRSTKKYNKERKTKLTEIWNGSKNETGIFQQRKHKMGKNDEQKWLRVCLSLLLAYLICCNMLKEDNSCHLLHVEKYLPSKTCSHSAEGTSLQLLWLETHCASKYSVRHRRNIWANENLF